METCTQNNDPTAALTAALKPCPFCGNPYPAIYGAGAAWSIRCWSTESEHYCNVSTDVFSTSEAAQEAWNTRAALDQSLAEPFDMAAHLQHQHEWSERTFGPGYHASRVIAHIRKELIEVEAAPNDLEEWIDVVILALDGAWRAGYSPKEIIAQLQAKQAKNEFREWPDWKTQPADKAIEHVRPPQEGELDVEVCFCSCEGQRACDTYRKCKLQEIKTCIQVCKGAPLVGWGADLLEECLAEIKRLKNERDLARLNEKYPSQKRLAAADRAGFERGIEEAARVLDKAHDMEAEMLQAVFTCYAKKIRSLLNPTEHTTENKA